MFAESVSYPAAFVAGLLSFFSPCVLPLIPAYFTFITGFSLEQLVDSPAAETRKKVLLSTLAYVLGFSLVFVMMGASASFLGGLIFKYRELIRIVGGVLIVLLGIHLTGLVRIRGLEFEKRIALQKKPLHFMGTFLIGMAFGAGWSPCIGPLLGSILILAGNQDNVAHGMLLLAIYSAGLALPFVIISVFINLVLVFLKRVTRIMAYINGVAGGLLIVIGLLLLTNRLTL